MKFFNKIKNINKTDYTKFALEEAIRKFTTSGKIDSDAVHSQFQVFFREHGI